MGMTVENRDTRQGIREVRKTEQGVLSLVGAVTQKVVSVLSRILSAAGDITADAGNTGDGTVTLFTIGLNSTPSVGNWIFELTAALVGKLTDPSGQVVASNIALTDGGATIVSEGGLVFTVTDGATAFVAGDKFTLAVETGSGNFVPYSPTGIAGASAPCAISLNEVVSTADGDFAVGAMLQGSVYASFVVIGTGDAGAGMTEEIKDSLHNYGIFVEDFIEASKLDNQ